jgi:PAS domain S-box-containing protein
MKLTNDELIVVLEERLDLLNAVVENSPDIIYVKDLEGRYLMINPAGAIFFGKPVAEVLGRTVREFLSAEDAAAVIKADRETIAADHPLTLELNYTISGITRTFLVIKGVYRTIKGEIAGIFGISREITERKHAEAEVLQCQEELRFLAAKMSYREEQQRRDIASALHDQIGQTLALSKIRMGLLTGGDDLLAEIKQICGLLDNAIQHTRTLTMELSPPILYELGFEAGVMSLCEEFQTQYGLIVEFYADDSDKPLSDELRGLLYQGVRELLVNIVKHARASSAHIAVERDGERIMITVEDNGIGFASDAALLRMDKNPGFGLFSLRERLKYQKGTCSVDSTPGHGTRVTLTGPLGANQS